MILKKRAVRQLGAAVAVCALAAACTQPPPQDPTPSPTPPPSPASVSPSETQLERETRVAFEAAQQAYRANMKEQDRVFAAGGALEATSILKSTSAEEYLAYTLQNLRAAKEEGWRTDNPTIIVGISEGVFSSDKLSMSACEDNRKVRLVYKDGKKVMPSGTRLYVQDLTFRKFAEQWKVTDLKSEQVKTFANETRCQS